MARRNLLESLEEVAGRLERAGSILVGLDFDGTLAPIRRDPARPCSRSRCERSWPGWSGCRGWM